MIHQIDSKNGLLILSVTSQQTFVLMKTSSRRLDQDEYIRLTLRLQKTSSRHFQDALIKVNIFALIIRLQDVFKTFSRRLQDVLQKLLQGIFKTSSRRLQDIFKTSSRLSENFFKTSSTISKMVIFRRICLGHISEKFMVSVQNLQV